MSMSATMVFRPRTSTDALAHLAVGHIGHDVLVGTDTGGQDFGNVGVRQGRETPVDAAGGGHAPLGADVAQGVDEGKDAVLVVVQDLLVVAGFDAAEGHGGAVGEPEGEYGRGDVRAEGNDTGVPADLDTGFQELLDGRGAVVVGRAEDVEASALVLFDDVLGDFRGRGGADDGGKTGGRAVHELHAAFSQDGVVGRTHPDLAGVDVRILFGMVEVRLVQDAQGFENLIGEDGGHAGVQQGPQVGQVVLALDMRGQQAPGECQGFFEVFQGFHLHAGEGVDHRQVVGGVGKADLGVGVVGLKCLFVAAFSRWKRLCIHPEWRQMRLI